ncbi:MAG: hypothetical protein M0R80_08965 [Proteobacteria bacterium]|nr:hypothetical protein [Pseudomonadota bacterium]
MPNRAPHGPLLAAALALLAIVALPCGGRAAAVTTCLTVQADDPKMQPGLLKLVEIELARHPSHALVGADCRVALTVELFRVGGSQQLTMRLDENVPIRFTIGKGDSLPARVSEAMSLVLGNDPVSLAEDITKLSAIERASHAMAVQGVNVWRFELFQAAYRTGSGAEFVPGGAFGVTRGARHWQVFGRLTFSGWPKEAEEDKPVLKIAAGADVGIGYELSANAAATFYFALGLGLQYLRFERRAEELGGGIDTINDFAPHAFGRIGVRMFRLYDFDFDIFVAGYLPMKPTKQDDNYVFPEEGRYTMSAQMGVGVGF